MNDEAARTGADGDVQTLGRCSPSVCQAKCTRMFGQLRNFGHSAWHRAVQVAGLVLLSALVSGCAVRGYDLGWREADRFAEHLGSPLDSASGCRWRAISDDAETRRCGGLIDDLDRELSVSRHLADQPGLRCEGAICSYRNVYERRDVGLALVVPVYRKIVVREVRARFQRDEGIWRVAEVVVVDTPPPNYGPVRVGG